MSDAEKCVASAATFIEMALSDAKGAPLAASVDWFLAETRMRRAELAMMNETGEGDDAAAA